MKQLNHKKITRAKYRKFLYTLLFSLTAATAWTQTAYLQLKTRAISENISPDFSYSISGGPTSVTNPVLSDRPDAFRRIYQLAGESAGGLFAIATSGTTAATPNPGNIYYRASASSEWVNTGFAAFRMDGGADGGFIAVVRTASSVAGSGSEVWYRSDAAATPVNITGALSGKSITQVSHNYTNRIYAVTTETGSNLYSRPADLSSDWVVSANPQNVVKIDAVPNSNDIFHTRIQSGSLRLYKGVYNTNGTLWDNDMGGNSTGNLNGHNFAATKNAAGTDHVIYYIPDYGGIYYKKSAAGNWETDESASQIEMLTSTGNNGQMVYGVLTSGEATLPHRIFSRAGMGEFFGFWIDDERVQTSVKGNTVIIPVAPGTYTVAQQPVAGWHTANIVNWDPSNNSTQNVANSTATVNVAAGEVVIVEFENQQTNIYDISTASGCAPAYKETFSTYVNGTYGNPLTGLTSYHKAGNTFGFGYYAVMTNTSALSNYAYFMSDHTNDAQRGMFVIDGSFERGTFFRKKFTGVQTGVPYSFSAFIANINKQGPGYISPNVSFEVYNSVTGALLFSASSGDIPADTSWHGVGAVFTSPVSNIELVLRNNALGTIGNDLAIDDISFSLAIPEPEAKVSYSCVDLGTVNVTAPLSASGSPIRYQYSIDGVNWQSATNFTNVPAGSYNLYVRYETATGCIAQSALTVTNTCVATPVQLLSFEAQPMSNAVRLNWSTASESNNKGFELHRSHNGYDWEYIGFVTSKAVNGNSRYRQDYEYIDATPLTSKNYYRLKQLDISGQYEYSQVKFVYFIPSEIKWSAHPNPFNDQLILDGLFGISSITLTNSAGQRYLYKHIDPQTGRVQLSVATLPPGTYTLTLMDNKGSSSQQLLVKTAGR
ncbi:MAG: T9SS type A sorting domain-containing protein [Taibaiella sp.]|nr:T9SS type A sorting domain-containing protein [Taibaiella sp.]